eukprot:1621438-Alexandrium_andersonii.AAC.1
MFCIGSWRCCALAGAKWVLAYYEGGHVSAVASLGARMRAMVAIMGACQYRQQSMVLNVLM